LADAKEHPESFEVIDAFGHLVEEAAYGVLGEGRGRPLAKLAGHAIKFYFKYLRRHPGHAAALNNAGVFLSNRGDYEQAREYFAAALAHAPTILPIHRNLRIADILAKKPIADWHEIPRIGQEDPGFLEAYFDPHAM
jgi:tetratricopeptide (TPR) repeat protein